MMSSQEKGFPCWVLALVVLIILGGFLFGVAIVAQFVGSISGGYR